MRNRIAKHALLWLACTSFMLGACGDDEGATVPDAGSDAAVEAGPMPCKTDAECDDDLVCTGVETCSEGVCIPGEPPECDDGIACTLDRCSERAAGCEFLPPDLDGDGHFDVSCTDADGETLGDDCDDNDPLRFPGNIEACDPDNRDDDCDPTTFGEKDSDNDGFFDSACCNGDNCGNDCDDLKAAVNPEATEACDLFDNDCDGETDEGVSVKMYPDEDHDGHGKKGGGVKSVDKCPGAVGFALVSNDCDDEDPERFEGQFEICDNKDNDCDSKTDEVQEEAPWFVDADSDSFGDPTSTPIYSCVRIPDRVLSSNDCRDDNAAIHPAAAEICDGIDNDCSGTKDFRLGTNDFEDDDDDGIADAACTGGEDCDDRDSTTGDGMEEICDMRDNDCDDAIDEQTAQTVWYLDRDGDGWGTGEGTALARCEPIPGRAANLGDCDDFENATHPGSLEVCNGKDDDCDGRKDEGTDFQCSLSNAASICKLGSCAVLSCFPGFGDCDGNQSNGCECVVPAAPLEPNQACAADSECMDGDYCNGKERCNPVDNLCYPGIPVNCTPSDTVLQGSVFIQNSLDIQNLAGIETITGDVGISAPGLVTLTGLESLKTIGGNLNVEDNPALVAMVGSGLSGLITVGGDILIEGNLKLKVIRLPALVTARSLTIIDNPALVTLDGFGSLVRLDTALLISRNPDLEAIPGLQALADVGTLEIMDLDSLTALTLGNLARVRGHVFIGAGISSYDNESITQVSLPELVRVDGHVDVHGMLALTSLSLANLTTVIGSIDISNNEALATLSVPKLATLGPATLGQQQYSPGIYIRSNAALSSLESFGAATIDCPSQGCSYSIAYNDHLTNCQAAGAVERSNNFQYPDWYSNGAALPPEQTENCPDNSGI